MLLHLFLDSLFSICPKKMETEKWLKAADSPLYIILLIGIRKNAQIFYYFFNRKKNPGFSVFFKSAGDSVNDI